MEEVNAESMLVGGLSTLSYLWAAMVHSALRSWKIRVCHVAGLCLQQEQQLQQAQRGPSIT